MKHELKHAAPRVITSDAQLEEYTHALIELEEHAHKTADERGYASLLAALIQKYESEHHTIKAATPEEVLAELIEQNGLKQRELVPLLGTESVVSEIVNGKRPLSRANIEKLSRRFRVSPAVFFTKEAAADR
jgi:HTH-type transcriptional regulator/antitoxin HigA